MKAVLYLRYSAGGNQTEQSIEGQRRECEEYAKAHDINIIGEYADRHISGKSTDGREQFQQLIKDSATGRFDAVILYKIDRFARNRYDSAIYKSRLKKNGVKVLYAKEAIPDGPEGIILESLLEGMAEYYSAELAQKIRRGMKESAIKCHATGGYQALGYKVAKDKTFIVDEDEAPIVQKIFAMFDEGHSAVEICTELNGMGCRTSRGAVFNKNSLRTILRNEKYIGVYASQGIRVEGGVPAIIDPDLFLRVQSRIAMNKRNPAHYKAPEKYFLSGKIYCGYCNSAIIGVSGTGAGAQRHFYYSCTDRIRKKNCHKQNIRKDVLERLVAEGTVNYILQDEQRIDHIARRCVEIQAANPNTDAELTFMESQLLDTKKTLANLMAAIESGIITKTTKQRLQELETMQEKLECEIESYKLRTPELNVRPIKFMLEQMRQRTDEPDDEYRERLLDCFVNSVYLYEDKAIVTFNLTNEKAVLESTAIPLLNPNPDDPNIGCSFLDLFGGGEENRTPVRKLSRTGISGCRMPTTFPQFQADNRAETSVAS